MHIYFLNDPNFILKLFSMLYYYDFFYYEIFYNSVNNVFRHFRMQFNFNLTN